MRPHCPPDVTPTLPPISSLTTPYTPTPPPLTILTLTTCPPDMPPMPLAQCPPDMPPMALTILMLTKFPHTGLILNTTYDPYAPTVPSRLDSNAALTLPYLLCHLQFLCSGGALKICLPPPESGIEISDIVSSHELAIEVESLAHESNPDPPGLPECEHRFILNVCSLSKPDTFGIAFISAQPPISHKLNFKIYEKEKTVETCAPTEDAGQDDAQKNQNDSKIPDYVGKKIAEALSLLKMDLDCVKVGESLPEGSRVVIGVPGKGLGKRRNLHATKKTNKKCCTFEVAKVSWDQGDDMINVEVDHIDNEPPHTESPLILNETIHDETPPASPQNIEAFQERETIKHDIMPDPEPKVSSSANF
ncbi:hypothetical protein O181_010814 [Austropuccinia psidii MF-1]|uniref:Uncharacterized protein n=1 Tax=Austropuccinia psidii MF-1 TaxID=1389203 RepID=A0A9Q3GL92_9BASI|nr:hypothetical protein [Austropuccinia psidii MF-1]